MKLSICHVAYVCICVMFEDVCQYVHGEWEIIDSEDSQYECSCLENKNNTFTCVEKHGSTSKEDILWDGAKFIRSKYHLKGTPMFKKHLIIWSPGAGLQKTTWIKIGNP